MFSQEEFPYGVKRMTHFCYHVAIKKMLGYSRQQATHMDIAQHTHPMPQHHMGVIRSLLCCTRVWVKQKLGHMVLDHTPSFRQCDDNLKAVGQKKQDFLVFWGF